MTRMVDFGAGMALMGVSRLLVDAGRGDLTGLGAWALLAGVLGLMLWGVSLIWESRSAARA